MSELDPFVIAAFGPPPPGINLNEETETRNDIITGVFLALAVISVLARWIARKLSGARLQADDYVIFVSLILCIVTAIVNILFGPAGSGHHVWTLTRAILTYGLKLAFIYTFIWAVTVSVTKLSIILLYRRIFAVQKSPFRNWLDFLACIMVFQIIAITVSNLTVCKPLDYLWNQLDPNAHGTCFDRLHFLLITGIINAVFDIIILITPIAAISKLRLSFWKKAGIFGMLFLGALVCVASWVRVYYLAIFTTAIDTTWVSGETATWSSIEASLGIVSACLPVLRPLYLKARNGRGLSTLVHTAFSPKTSKNDYSGSKCQSNAQTHSSESWRNPTQNILIPNQSDEAINLTNFVSSGLSEAGMDPDRITVRSEVKQSHSYV
ncbi:hypothetical protein F4679DRAFT_525941 [Xylaria curta]|nr:hypothetical protein F4679DRAFT_525941 [Xylaria curta]